MFARYPQRRTILPQRTMHELAARSGKFPPAPHTLWESRVAACPQRTGCQRELAATPGARFETTLPWSEQPERASRRLVPALDQNAAYLLEGDRGARVCGRCPASAGRGRAGRSLRGRSLGLSCPSLVRGVPQATRLLLTSSPPSSFTTASAFDVDLLGLFSSSSSSLFLILRRLRLVLPPLRPARACRSGSRTASSSPRLY